MTKIKDLKGSLKANVIPADVVPTNAIALSSVQSGTEADLGGGNVYFTKGGGNDRQISTFKQIQVMGSTHIGYLNCWTDTTNWVMETGYKRLTGLQVPLYDGLRIDVRWSGLVLNQTDVNPYLNVDGYGNYPVKDGRLRYYSGEDVDANFIRYEETYFIFDKPREIWLCYQQTPSLTLMTEFDITGYVGKRKLDGGSIDIALNPRLYSVFGEKLPNLADTALVGQSSLSPFGINTLGQIENITGSFDIAGGLLKNTPDGAFTLSQLTSTSHVPFMSDSQNLEDSVLFNTSGVVRTGTKTLTQRLGVAFYIAV